ncbi:alpha/beta-hydrolase [Acrodontium crateriforme]|uniref:Carboxypeptidase n=1 Tax=Acrodontium crateriforme TaxID=150365 RepID=A0AAQ3M5T4_9PEZI|nr:alpha/beta-hydrolase [Acrodontium crateriforme]
MRFFATLSCFVGLSTLAQAALHRDPAHAAKRLHAEHHSRAIVERHAAGESFKDARLQKRASRWLTSKTKKFAVNGTGLPDVPFDVGESYAGLLPISNSPHETRELFFWFFPTTNPDCHEEITIWLNGGPGCSSLSGLITENGPFTWEDGTVAPTQNPYSWTNLTNVLWVEQPVGVGFSQGTPNIVDEVQLGKEFVGFYKQFVKTFAVQKWKLYITGESYAGYYVPYIADSFITAADPDIHLGGIAINDPIIGDETAQQQVTILPFVDFWSNLFYINDTARAELHKIQKECGYDAYLEKYLRFPPPKGPFPVLRDPYYHQDVAKCAQFDNAFSIIADGNPCFNIYHITQTCPTPFSINGAINVGDYVPPGFTAYFNRTEVQKAINAPVGTNWQQCTDINVFGNGDNSSETASDKSLGPAQDGVLQRVIEVTNNVIIGSGDLDFILNTNGTLLALQNTTWNGGQGLHEYPKKPFLVPFHPEYNDGALSGAGTVGTWTHARGLTFYTVRLSGHELPGYAPGAGYRALELLLGRIKSLDQRGDFTTQHGNFGNN